MKRIISLLLVLVLCLGVFAGCGNEAPAADEPAAPAATEPKAPEVQEPAEESGLRPTLRSGLPTPRLPTTVRSFWLLRMLS